MTAIAACGLFAPAAHAGVVFDDVARTVTVTPEFRSELTNRERFSWSVWPASGGRLRVTFSGGYPYPTVDPLLYDRVIFRIRGKAHGSIRHPRYIAKSGVSISVESVGSPKTSSLYLRQPHGPMRVIGKGNRVDLNADGTTDLRFVRTRLHLLDIETDRRGNDLIDFGKFRPWAINVFPRGIGSTITTYRGRDRIIATPGADAIYTGAGNKIIKSLGRRDEIRTGHGNSRIWAGPGDDEVILGNGDNRVWGGSGSDWIKAGKGRNVLVGGKGNDDLMAGGKRGKPNLLVGGPGKDQLWSATNASWLYGNKGDDTLSGTGAKTHMIGGSGKDNMRPSRRKGKIPHVNCGKGSDHTYRFIPARFRKGCEWYWADDKSGRKLWY